MKKRRDITITVELPEGHSGWKVGVDRETGLILLVDAEGNKVSPKGARRAVHYERPKGEKIQTLTYSEGDILSVGGLEEISKLELFFVIDTNTKLINGEKVSVAFFFRWKIQSEGEKYKLIPFEQDGFIFEIRNFPECEDENPEMFAILKLCNDVLRKEHTKKSCSIGFVTDSNMDSIKNISSQIEPIYGDQFLPKQFRLFYASADTGEESLNRLMRICDREANKYLKRLIDDPANGMKHLSPTLEDTRVLCSCRSFPIISFENDIMNEIVLTKDSTYSIKFE